MCIRDRVWNETVSADRSLEQGRQCRKWCVRWQLWHPTMWIHLPYHCSEHKIFSPKTRRQSYECAICFYTTHPDTHSMSIFLAVHHLKSMTKNAFICVFVNNVFTLCFFIKWACVFDKNHLQCINSVYSLPLSLSLSLSLSL